MLPPARRIAARPPPAFCRGPPAARCLLPVACCPPPAACFLLCAARCPPPVVCPAGCPRLPVRVAGGVVWHFWHCGTRIVPGSFLLFLPLPVVPASSCCSCLFLLLLPLLVAPGFFVLFPPPPSPGRGRPEKVTAHPLSGYAADREYACRYSGSFPVPQRVLGLGPSHSSSRPPRANSS